MMFCDVTTSKLQSSLRLIFSCDMRVKVAVHQYGTIVALHSSSGPH